MDGTIRRAVLGGAATVRRFDGMTDTEALDTVGRARYLRLTTFRKDGTPVATPVWLVRDGAHLLVITGGGTGKVKRLRHTPRVLLAPSDGRGKVKPGVAEVEGTAEIVTDPAELARLVGLLKKRYGVVYSIATFVQRLRGIDTSSGAQIRISL